MHFILVDSVRYTSYPHPPPHSNSNIIKFLYFEVLRERWWRYITEVTNQRSNQLPKLNPPVAWRTCRIMRRRMPQMPIMLSINKSNRLRSTSIQDFDGTVQYPCACELLPTGGCFWIYLDYLKTRKGIRRYSRVSKVNLIWPLIIRGKFSWVPVWVDDSDYWRIALPNSGIKCVLVQYLNTLMEQQLRARGCHTSPWWWYNKLSVLPNCFHPKLITIRQKNRVVLLANIKECSHV